MIVASFLGCCCETSAAEHSAGITLGEDAGYSRFTGVSSPTGSAEVNIENGNPGYLNNITGGEFGGSTGTGGIVDPYVNDVELVGLAIHITDTAGASHSLSDDDDPALTDIVSDLNSLGLGGSGYIAYPYSEAPRQYTGQLNELSAGESANGGQPFDILIAEFYRIPAPYPPGGNSSFLNW